MRSVALILVLCLASSASAQSTPLRTTYGAMKEYRATNGQRYWKFVADPPVPDPPPVTSKVVPVLKSYSGFGYMGFALASQPHTVTRVFNGQTITEEGCEELRLIGASLRYRHNGRYHVLGPYAEWYATADATPKPPADKPSTEATAAR